MSDKLLKKYAEFLLEKEIDEFTFYCQKQVSSIGEIKTKVKSLFDRLEIDKIVKEGILIELSHLGKIEEVTLECFKKFKSIYEFLEVINAIKNSFISFIPKFTQDASEVVELVIGLDQYFNSTLKERVLELEDLVKNEAYASDFINQANAERVNYLEKKYKEASNFIKKVTDNSPLFIVIFDLAEDRPVYINNSIINSFGIDKDTIYKLKFSHVLNNFIYSEDRSKISSRIEEFKKLKDDQYGQVEYRIVDEYGNIRWVFSRSMVFKRVKGEVTQIILNAIDVTELKNTEEELVRSKKFVDKILSASPNVVYIFDRVQRKMIYSNKSISKLVGYSQKELEEMGDSVVKLLIHPDDYERLDQYIINFEDAKDNEVHEIEYRIKMNDGNYKWFWSHDTVFLRDDDNRVIQTLGVAEDIDARVKAELQLRKRESQLVAAQEIAHVGSFEWDINSDIISGSKEFYRITGLNSRNGGITIEDFKEILNEKELDKLEKNLSKLNSDPINTSEAEYEILTPNNGLKTIMSKVRIIRDLDNKPEKVVGTILDITILKNAQKALKNVNSELEERVTVRTKELKESERRYSNFIKQSSEGIWRYEFDGIESLDINLPIEEQIDLILKHSYIAECNEKMAKIHGFESSKELVGIKLTDALVHTNEEQRQFVRTFIESGYNLKDVESVELDKFGNKIYLQSSVVGIIENNKLGQTWGVQKDISEKTLALKELRESEEQYRFLAETVPHIFWTAKPDGKVDFYNSKWEEFTGADLGESKGFSWRKYIHPDDLDRVFENWMKSVESGEPFQEEYKLLNKDGHYYWHLERALPYKDGDGNIVKWMGTCTDINDQKLFQDELADKNKELVKINNDLDNFIYTASHDLKAPIANIEGLLYSLETVMSTDSDKNKDMKEILGMMLESVNKFRRTIRDLTEVTKAQKSSQEAVVENDLNELLEEVESMVADLKIDSNASIKSDFSEVSTIEFSRKNLRSILYNLISNAIKYRSEKPPEIFVKTRNLDDYILLTVKDNGMGFNKDQVEKVFSMFKRLHSHVEGSGVGLYIVKRIVTNAGGKIEVESELGKGAEFKVYFKK